MVIGLSEVFSTSILGPAGCSGSAQSPNQALLSDAPLLATLADWDDIDAAVVTGVERAEAVVVDRREAARGTRREFSIRTALNEPGLVVAQQTESDSGSDPVRVQLRCSIGRFGDPIRENRLLGFVRDRLVQLRGVDFAPLVN